MDRKRFVKLLSLAGVGWPSVAAAFGRASQVAFALIDAGEGERGSKAGLAWALRWSHAPRSRSQALP